MLWTCQTVSSSSSFIEASSLAFWGYWSNRNLPLVIE